MIGTLTGSKILRIKMSVLRFGEGVGVVKVVVVVVGQLKSGHGEPLGQPDWHGHWFIFSFKAHPVVEF